MKEEYKIKISNAIRNCERYGFIDYEHTWEYKRAMYEFTNEAKKLVKSGFYELAFDICTLLLESIPETEIDDSKGSTKDLAKECIEIIKNILDIILKTNNPLNFQVLNYISKEIDSQNLANYGIELDCLFNTYIENKAYLNKIEEILINALEKNKENAFFYRALAYINYLESIYEIKNEPNKYKEVLEKYSQESKVFLKYIDLLLNENEIDKAIVKLKERAKEDYETYKSPLFYEKLVEVYLENNRMEEYKLALYELLLDYHDYRIEIYRQIKQLFSKEEWEKERENIITKLKKQNASFILKLIYIEENKIDDLFSSLKDTCMKTIIPYEKYLLPKYNDKLVALYIKDCFKQSSMVSNRKEYRALANDVMHIKNMKNSKEPVETLLQNLQETYFQNRPAMKDEFRKCMR